MGYTTTKIIIKKNISPWWSQEQQKNENGNQAKQRKKKENQNTSTIVNKKLTKDLEPKTESVLTYRGENRFSHTEGEKTIKPDERFEDVTFQNPTDWEAFDNLAKDHGIPTLADLKKGENYSAYLTKTDYITEPEPHPYQEILKQENHLAIKEKIFKAEKMEEKEPTKEKILKVKELVEDEITKEKIPKVEKMISNEKIKKKVIAG